MNETANESLVTYRIGIVEEVDAAKAKIKVKLPDLDDMVTHWLSVPQRRTLEDQSYDVPDEGTQVAILLDQRGEEGIVIGAIYSEVDPPPVDTLDKWHRTFKDGTIIEYDRADHVLKVDAQGEITLKATGPITIEGISVKIKATTLIELEAPMTMVNSLTVAGKLKFIPMPPLAP